MYESRQEIEEKYLIYADVKMKTYKYLYDKMLDENIIRNAYKKLRKGKNERPEVQYINMHFDEMVRVMYTMLKNTKPEGCYVEHPELAFRPAEKKPKYRLEHGKWRETYSADIMEQWVHHIIVMILEPIIMRSQYIYSCASLPKRGMHKGKKAVERWFKDYRGTKYFAKADIRRFYPHLKLKMVFKWMRTIIKDEWFMYILELCYTGLDYIVLGFYPSQWIANWYLQRMDYFIKQELGIRYYIRYADDIVMIGPNKKALHHAMSEVRHFLLKIGLKFKRNYQVCRALYNNGKKTVGRALDFMGFKFLRYATVLRKRILLESTRCAKRIANQIAGTDKIYVKDARRMLSYMGWFSHTDTYDCYLAYIKPFVSVRRLKRVVSISDRRDRRNDGLEKRNNTGQTCAVAAGCT